jgi:predicted metal-binding protein
MPKFLVGCLVVLAVLVIGGGTAGYFLVIKPAWNFASEMGQFATEYQSLNAGWPSWRRNGRR